MNCLNADCKRLINISMCVIFKSSSSLRIIYSKLSYGVVNYSLIKQKKLIIKKQICFIEFQLKIWFKFGRD